MTVTPVSDSELALVAQVAGRERWSDLSAPPDAHGPRTIAEELAVSRFRTALPRPRGPRATRLQARLALVALSVVVLGACWWVSPTRTAIGVFGAGLFSLIALRRSQRRQRPPDGGRRGPAALVTAMRGR
jgi:hypothetical protein